MIIYLRMLLFVSLFYFIHLLNYIVLRETDHWLYLGRFFDYTFNIYNIFLGYIMSVPFIAFTLKSSINKIFPMLLSTLMLLGVLPGVIIYSLSSDQSIYAFYFFYVYLVFILSFFTRKEIKFISTEKIKDISFLFKIQSVNLLVLKIFGMIGLVFYIYLTIKYFNIIHISSLSDVYIQRSLFASVVSEWEVYFITFSKYISAFSFLIIAINLRKVKYLYPTIFIYLIDYSLASHKASIVLMIFAIAYYFILSKIDIKRYFFRVILVCGIVFSFVLQIAVFLSTQWLPILIALHDRVFYVTAGLFARYYDFANEHYFFYGGAGLIGKLFSNTVYHESYADVIGETYFSENVHANADLISDGYINFGITGAFLQIFMLWLFFNKKDNAVFENNFNSLIPMIFTYSMVLFSMGLQTTLLTGGMFFFILLVKFGFTNSYIRS
jgi:hypothetical protein